MIKRYKILQIALGLLVMMSATQGYAQSGVKYPYIQGGDKASNIIVSRDASGGADPSCIHSNWSGATPSHTGSSSNNKVPAKLEVATSDAQSSVTGDVALGSCPSGWRLPTQREMMLIFVMRDKLRTSGFKEDRYWTSTISDIQTDAAYDMDFSSPNSNICHHSLTMGVRCVRDVN